MICLCFSSEIRKYKNIKFKDAYDYYDKESEISKEDIKVLMIYCHSPLWMDNWFRKNSKNKHIVDDFILEKEDILKFKQFCLEVIESGHENYDSITCHFCFSLDLERKTREEETYRINKVLKDIIKELDIILEDDFDNNSFIFSSYLY